TNQEGKAGNGEVAQNRSLKLKHTSTHRFPDKLPTCGQPGHAGLMPFNWVPNTAETVPDSHDGHFGFCPAKSQLYRAVVKQARGKPRSGREWDYQSGFWQMAA